METAFARSCGGDSDTDEDEVSYPALAYKNHFIYRIGRNGLTQP